MLIPIGRPSAALDPFGLFIAFIIIVNVISAFRRMRRQQQASGEARQQAQTPSQPTRLQDAMRKAAADAAAARQAQRARMEQAIRAAQARLQQQVAASEPIVLTQTPQSPTPPAPPAGLTAPQAESLPSFEYAQDMLQSTDQAPVSAPAATYPVLGSPLTGMQLFVAAAIVGPPAALRTVGHTPAGW
jgi:hypothetical protein